MYIPGISDHEIVCVDCDLRAQVNKKPPRKIYLWSKADWANMKQAMVEFRDEFLAKFHLRSVEDNYLVFKGVVHSLLDSYIPSKITISRCNMPWFNNTLKDCVTRNRDSLIRLKEQERHSTGSSISPLRKIWLKP